MSEQSYSKKFSVSASTESVYKAITKEVNEWWTTESNEAAEIGNILTVKFGASNFMSMEVERAIFNELILWKVVGANMFIEGGGSGNDEWVGTKIQWKIAGTESGSEVFLFHEGLLPSFDCYETCKNGWDYFLASLKEYLNTGKGTPYTGAITK